MVLRGEKVVSCCDVGRMLQMKLCLFLEGIPRVADDLLLFLDMVVVTFCLSKRVVIP